MTTQQLVHALAQAARPIEEHKKDLFGRVQTLKKESQHMDERTQDEVVQLEQHLDRVLQMEEKLLKQQKVTKKQVQQQHGNEEVAKKLDKIQFLLGELGAKMNSLTRIKEHHERRKKALDHKVKTLVDKSESLQSKLEVLEKKIEQNKESIAPERLAALLDRVKKLRARLEPSPPLRFIVPESQHEIFFSEEQPTSTMEVELAPPPTHSKSFVRKLFGM